MKNAFGSGYLDIKYKDKPLSLTVTSFKYVHAEEEDDQCDIQIHSDDPNIVDHEAFGHNAEWVVTWGLIEDKLISHTEKIYLEEIIPTFDREGITITIIAHDKATVLKKSTSMAIHTGATLPAVVATEAKKHGITTYIEKEFAKAPTILLKGALGDIIDNAKAQAKLDYLNSPKAKQDQKDLRETLNSFPTKLQRDYYADKSNYLEVEPGVFKEYSVIYPGSELRNLAIYDMVRKGKLDPAKAKFAQYYLSHYDKYGNIPQANKTPAQLIKSLAKKGSNGLYHISGHGDTIVIKSRNIKKKPIYSYKYKAGSGELLTFKPETRNKSKQSGSTATAFTGWDSLNKEAYYGKVQDGNNPNVANYLGGGGVNNSGSTNQSTVLYLKPMSENSGPSNFGGTQAIRDNLVNSVLVPVRENESLEDLTLSKENQDRLSAIASANKVKMAPTRDIVGAFGNASNSQAQDAYDQNPGSFLVVGNPILISGEVINISNVGKAYSGNYYLIKVIHELDPTSGYLTTGELARNTVGNTIKNTKTKTATKASTKLINDEVRNKTFSNHKTKVIHSTND